MFVIFFCQKINSIQNQFNQVKSYGNFSQNLKRISLRPIAGQKPVKVMRLRNETIHKIGASVIHKVTEQLFQQ